MAPAMSRRRSPMSDLSLFRSWRDCATLFPRIKTFEPDIPGLVVPAMTAWRRGRTSRPIVRPTGEVCAFNEDEDFPEYALDM